MKTDALAKLLSDADAAAHPPLPGRLDLASAVRMRSARRSRFRRGGGLMVAGCAATAIVLVSRNPSTHPDEPVARGPDVAQLRAEVAELDSQARLHVMTARAVARAMAPHVQTTTGDLMAIISVQRESAAAVLVHEADQLANRTDKKLAREAYERAARLFYDTAGGQQAQKQLREGI